MAKGLATNQKCTFSNHRRLGQNTYRYDITTRYSVLDTVLLLKVTKKCISQHIFKLHFHTFFN